MVRVNAVVGNITLTTCPLGQRRVVSGTGGVGPSRLPWKPVGTSSVPGGGNTDGSAIACGGCPWARANSMVLLIRAVRTARINNTMEFARAQGQPPQAMADPSVFPPPGTELVPTGFQGNLEGPTPPVPLTTRRWPSGQVVSVMFPTTAFTLTTHKLYDGMCREVVHSTFRAANAPEVADSMPDPNNRNPRFVFLYADSRLQGNTRHTVELRGTLSGAPWSRVWAFTTSP